MKKQFLFLLVVFGISALHAQIKKPANNSARINYQIFINGKEAINEETPELIYRSQSAVIEYHLPEGKTAIEMAPEEKIYMDFESRHTYVCATLSQGDQIYTMANFDKLPEFEDTGKEEKILGFKCKQAKTVSFSNTIEIWYTTEAGLLGGPSSYYYKENALVLKVVRNGSYIIQAGNIEYLRSAGGMPGSLVPTNLGRKVERGLYRNLLADSYVKTIDIFSDEQIAWGHEKSNPSGEQFDVTYRFAGGTIIAKKVKLPYVSNDYNLFAELTQYSNGDAYDRTGSVFMIPTGKEISFLNGLRKGPDSLPLVQGRNEKSYQGIVSTPQYDPLIEMMRFFTSFGVRQYNEKVKIGKIWEDSSRFKQDITPLMPLLQGDVWIGVFIGNYDKGGHKVSLKLKYYPGEKTVQENAETLHWIQPLFNTCNVMEMAGQNYGTLFEQDSLTVSFNIPHGLKKLQLQYISTGHGGWGGGDEFNQKTNTLLMDHKVIYSFIPWRCDCGVYRPSNPASGNFWNGLSSSDLSRSGWCPGTLTNPISIPINDLTPGEHTLQVAIPLGASEGGSFSSWNVSGVLIGEFK